MSEKACLKCGSELPATAATARPRTYCSVACRRLAELEIKRRNRRLERLEGSLSHERMVPDDEFWGGRQSSREERLKCLASEIVALTEQRLRALINGERWTQFKS